MSSTRSAGGMPPGVKKRQAVPPKPVTEVSREPKEDLLRDKLPELLVASNIPSGFVPYPEGSTISYRVYSWGEIKKLSHSHNLPLARQIESVLKGVYTEGISNTDITMNDFLYLAFLRRLSSIGDSRYRVLVECPHSSCRHSQNKVFSLQNIQFESMKAPRLPIVATLGTAESLQFEPLTVGDYLDLIKSGYAGKRGVETLQKALSTLILDNEGESEEANSLRSRIADLNDDTSALMAKQIRNLPFLDAYQLVETVGGDDSRLLDDIEKHLDHGVKQYETTCDKCGGKMFVAVDNPASHITPFRTSVRDAGNGLQFGVPDAS